MSTQLHLDAATSADIQLIRDLAERIWFACYPGIISPAQIRYMIDWMYAPQKLATEIARGVQYRIARVDGIPSGYLAWEVEDRPDGKTAHLNKVYLLPERHGFGLGQRLLSRFLEEARSSDAQWAELRVNRANLPAQKAYLRAGFENKDSVVTDIGSGFVMDDLIFRRPISLVNHPTDTNAPVSE